jgi:hypothetical protein
MDGPCLYCKEPLNDFNRTSNSTCIDCRERAKSKRPNVACAVERAVLSAARISSLTSGLDALRDDYFHAKVLNPHINKEQALNEEA